MDIFRTGGWGGAQPHSVAFGGVFPNITEAILVDEISTKVRIYPPKRDHLTPKFIGLGFPVL